MQYQYIRPENAIANNDDVDKAILNDHTYEELADKFVIRDMSTSVYYVFDNANEYQEFIEECEEMHFEEVIFHNMHQRFKFDIDMNEIIDADEEKAMINDFITDLRCCFDHVYSADISDDIVVCTSHGKKKHSYHIIVKNPAAPNSKEAAFFTQELVCNYIHDKPIMKYLDTGVNKSVQNFRLINCSKPGNNRVKILRDVKKFEEYDSYINIRAVSDEYEIVDSVLADNNPQQHVVQTSDTIALRVADYAHQHAESNGCYTNPRATSPPGLLIYDRKTPAFCDICNRVHANDNTFMVQYFKDDAGMLCVVRKCRKTPGGKLIGKYNVDDVTYEPSDFVTTRPVLAYNDKMDSIPIKNIYTEPSLRPFEMCGTLYVKAAMKMGKTKALLTHLNQYFNDAPIIRYLSFRQTFSANVKEKFNNFTLYSDVTGPLTQDKLIIQIESLHRLQIRPGAQVPDLLILDESESIIEQFDSGLSKNLNVCFPTFKWLVAHSKHVICMDANLTNRTLNVISSMRNDPKPVLHWNQYQNCADYKHFITFNRNEWITSLGEKIGQGKNIAIASNSLDVAKTLYNMLSKYDIRIKLYSSATTASEKKLHFGNVNKYWKDYNVVIYTPTVTAGVSFEQKHFDYVYVYATDLSCSVETLTQMIGRIRNVGEKEIYTCFNTTYRNYPVTRNDILTLLKTRREMLFKENNGLAFEYTASGDIKFYKTEYLDIYVENTIIKNLSLNNYVGRYKLVIEETGATISKLENIDYDNVAAMAAQYNQSMRQARQEDNSVIVAARDISIEESRIIGDKIQNDENISEEDYHAYKKFKLRSQYNYSGTITEQFVDVYNNKNARIIYKNLIKIKQSDGDIDKMLADIKENEKNNYVYAVNNNLADDINRYYSYPFHMAAAYLMKLCGFSLQNSNYVPEATIMNNVKNDQDRVINAVNTVIVTNRAKLLTAHALNVLDSDEYIKVVIKHISNVLNIMYGSRIVRGSSGNPRVYDGICRLMHTTLFDCNADQPSLNAKPLHTTYKVKQEPKIPEEERDTTFD